MYSKSVSSFIKAGFFPLAIFLASAVLPIHATAGQNINCVFKGGNRQISIDYSGPGCRTLYNSGSGQYKEIAWAKTHLHLCKEVANDVMAKSGRSSWDCDADTSIKHARSHASSENSRKKAGHRSSSDYAILKSSER